MNEQTAISGSLALNSAPHVIMIPASGPVRTRKLRVAAYARVSSNSEDQIHSFAAQNAYYTELITGNPEWEFVDVYADEGITGTSAEKRDDFQRLLKDCRRGRIDKVLTKSTARFARNTSESLMAVRELRDLGIGVCFEEQGIDTAQMSGELLTAIFSMIARRRAQTGGTSKSAPTGRSKYSGKYILTNLMFCGHCGTGYRRCVWNKGGVKRAVWRCGSRLDYGAKYCKHSETLEEKPLQQAILNAINSVMDSRDALEVQLMGAMEQELAPIPGETMSLADIDRMLEELEKQFNSLLAEASAAGGTEDYAERFRMISNAMADLKEHKSRIKQVYQENELVSQRLKAASIAMSAYAAELTEWDQSVVYQLVEKVTVLAKDKIRVTFRNGTEVEQEIEQLDWRNAS